MEKKKLEALDLSMNSKVVVFGWFAEAYYSKATAYEIMFLPKEQYDELNLKNAFVDYERYIDGLDGKHSEVEADVFIKEETLLNLLANETLYKALMMKDFYFDYSNEDWFMETFIDGDYEFNLYDLNEKYLNQLNQLKEVYDKKLADFHEVLLENHS